MIRALPLIIGLVLTVWTLIDCIQTPSHQVRNLPKVGWILLILLLTIIGPIAWLIAGRPRRPSGPGRRGRRSVPPPLPPDDDPEFLAKLEWERRREELRREREGRNGGKRTEGPDDAPQP